MRRGQYHGGFDHPIRAFVIGITLLVLLFGGFAVGIEAGTHPRSADVSTIDVSGQASTRVVTQKVTSRVVTVQGKVVRLPGTTTTKVVKVIVVRDSHGRVHYYLQPASTSGAGDPVPAYTVVLTGAPIKITGPAGPPTTLTVTQTAPGTTQTETVTVTETTPPPTSDTSNSTTTP